MAETKRILARSHEEHKEEKIFAQMHRERREEK